MAKKKDQQDEVIVDIEEVYSKSEQFVEKYKKQLTYVVGSLAVIVAGYFAYINLYLEPLEKEARSEMFRAEQYFAMDSLDKAINGDGVSYGFVDIIDIYGGTKSSNLAHYYLGISYLKQGLYEDAIDELESFSSTDVMLASVAEGGGCSLPARLRAPARRPGALRPGGAAAAGPFPAAHPAPRAHADQPAGRPQLPARR